MSVDDVLGRLLNPVVLATMVIAGVAYGWWILWALQLRPNARLLAAAVSPGVVFLAVVWSVRSFQGVVATTYIALIVDWLIFSSVGVLTVIARRRWQRRKR
jgi:hypothetical protein